jgi:F-type H+-transporting ATPase subunit b
LADARTQAKEVIAAAEKSGEASATRIVAEAEDHLSQERAKLRSELREELASLVVETTEKVIRKKLSTKEDLELINNTVKELQK